MRVRAELVALCGELAERFRSAALAIADHPDELICLYEEGGLDLTLVGIRAQMDQGDARWTAIVRNLSDSNGACPPHR